MPLAPLPSAIVIMTISVSFNGKPETVASSVESIQIVCEILSLNKSTFAMDLSIPITSFPKAVNFCAKDAPKLPRPTTIYFMFYLVYCYFFARITIVCVFNFFENGHHNGKHTYPSNKHYGRNYKFT